MSGSYLRVAVVWLAIAGAGCTSAPVRYYTLTATPEKTPSAAEADFAIDIRVVRVPPQLNRSELLVRTGPAEMILLENERWASPVNDEIKGALRSELQRRVGRLSGLRPAYSKLTLDIDVRRFEAEFDQYALLDASWSATLSATGRHSSGERTTTCTFRADEAVHAGYAGMVEGYQRDIAALAEAIVAVLMSSAGGGGVSCQ